MQHVAPMWGSSWLITGGAGYIGSHIVSAFSAAGARVIVVDDLSSGFSERVHDVAEVVQLDLCSKEFVHSALDAARNAKVDGIVHVAAKKSVPESIENPLFYFEQNTTGTLAVLRFAEAMGVKRILYSSTAAVYGDVQTAFVDESHSTNPVNPYGQSKLAAEWAIASFSEQNGVNWGALRYFNVAGAAEDRLGERDGRNLLPLVARAAITGMPLKVFGGDYATEDGSCLRDYIHVSDLADAHVSAAIELLEGGSVGILNVGRNVAVSVFSVIETYEEVFGIRVPYDVVERRAGDPASVVADARKINGLLGWQASRDLRDMVSSQFAVW